MTVKTRTPVAAVIASSETDSTAVDIVDTASASFLIPAAFTGTSGTFKASATKDGTYAIVSDSTGTAVTVTSIATSSAEWYPVPDEVLTHGFFKIIGSSQGAERSITVISKES